jgi:hypothetical protein
MPNRRIDVFFYGLFMDADVLGSKGLSPQNIRRAEAPGFALRIEMAAFMSVPGPSSNRAYILWQLAFHKGGNRIGGCVTLSAGSAQSLDHSGQ